MLEIGVEGLAELDAKLKTLSVKVETNILRGAVRAGQKVVLDKVRADVPTDSGALKKSVRLKADRKALKRGVVRADVTAGDKTAWYAHLIEFGTGSFYEGTGGKSVRRPYVIKAKTSSGAEASTGAKRRSLRIGGSFVSQVTHPGIRPQPFMRPAAESLQGPALDAFAAYVRKRLPIELEKARGAAS
jgi:HK97 gp10 family phage protein